MGVGIKSSKGFLTSTPTKDRPQFELVRRRIQLQPSANGKGQDEWWTMLIRQFETWMESHRNSPQWIHLEPFLEMKDRIFFDIYVLRPPLGLESFVTLQQEYQGVYPIIPAALTDIRCSYLSASALLLFLNVLMKTNYSLEGDPHLAILLQSYIDEDGLDFGMAYARLRPHWTLREFQDFELRAEKAEEAFEQCRQSLVTGNIIISSRLPPRRLWDLYSNRVIHTSRTTSRPHAHAACMPGEESCCKVAQWYAVSHSWVESEERDSVSTPVNGRQWRVPLPRDTSLEHVRIEILNIVSKEAYQEPAKASSYAWLDLLCLRQEDPEAKGEHLRASEHAIDVPTIGSVYYQCHSIIQYFCGLGRPFQLGNEDGKRHWLNRAWTLQESGSQRTAITAGVTPDSPPDPWDQCLCQSLVQPTSFQQRFNFLRRISKAPRFEIILEMIHRFSVNPVDQIAGLLYPLKAEWLYTYDAKEDTEQAWLNLLNVLQPETVACIAASFPVPGQKLDFLPTWHQIESLSPSWFESHDGSPTFAIPTYPSTPLAMIGGKFRGTCLYLTGVKFRGIGPESTWRRVRSRQVPERDSRQGSPLRAFVSAEGQEGRSCIVPSGALSNDRPYDLVLFEASDWAASKEKVVALIGRTEGRVFYKHASVTIFRHTSDRDRHLLGCLLEINDLTFM